MATTYGSYDAATGSYVQMSQEEWHNSLTADIQRAVDAFLGPEPPAKTLREIQEEEVAAAKAAKLAAEQRVAAAEAAKRQAEWQAQQEAAAKEAELERHRKLGHKACWLCERDKGIEAYHPCKENICPTATTGYTRFDRWGNPNTAYPAHPLREYYSAPGMPSHSNNFYKRAFREYDEEMWRQRQKEAKALKAAEDATGLTGEEAKAEYKRLRGGAPKHDLGAFLVEEPTVKATPKKGGKKPTVEKFSLDEL